MTCCVCAWITSPGTLCLCFYTVWLQLFCFVTLILSSLDIQQPQVTGNTRKRKRWHAKTSANGLPCHISCVFDFDYWAGRTLSYHCFTVNRPFRLCSKIIMYLAPGQTALGNIVCRQDTLSPAWSGSFQQGGWLEERDSEREREFVSYFI